jgi:DNA-binding MarR family transcriptional regulator
MEQGRLHHIAEEKLSPFIEVIRTIIRDEHREVNLQLTSPQIQLLQFLDNDGPLMMSEIATKLGITLGGVTALANRMDRAQLIERRRSEEDRRVVRLVITDEGKALLDKLSKARSKTLQKYFSKLSADEIKELERLCRKMLG